MGRDIQYLLDKYKHKQPGEIWTREHELEYIQDYRYKQRLFLLDGILNNLHGHFKITKEQKQRITYLIRELDFYLGHTTEDQFIILILVYVKMETNPNQRVKDFKKLFKDYKISLELYIVFLIKLNKYHISKLPLQFYP